MKYLILFISTLIINVQARKLSDHHCPIATCVHDTICEYEYPKDKNEHNCLLYPCGIAKNCIKK